MINRYVRRHGLGLLLGLVLVAATGGPAAAGDDTPPWPDTVPCATGAFTGHIVHPADFQGPYVDLQGWAQPCQDTGVEGQPVDASFGFAYFPPMDKEPLPGTAYAGRLRSYSTVATERTPFLGRFDFRAVGGLRTTLSICLLSDPTTRVSCVTVTYRPMSAADPVTVTPVSVSDPTVTGRITVVPPGSETAPSCGTCL